MHVALQVTALQIGILLGVQKVVIVVFCILIQCVLLPRQHRPAHPANGYRSEPDPPAMGGWKCKVRAA